MCYHKSEAHVWVQDFYLHRYFASLPFFPHVKDVQEVKRRPVTCARFSAALSWYSSVRVGHRREKSHNSSGKKQVSFISAQQMQILYIYVIIYKYMKMNFNFIGTLLGETTLKHTILKMANGWQHHRNKCVLTLFKWLSKILFVQSQMMFFTFCNIKNV